MIKLIIAFLVLIPTVSFADEYVSGYTRSDGTFVQGYYRSSPNSTVQDNYSYKGNPNPYTGQTGDNYYRHDQSSQYFQPSSYNAPTGLYSNKPGRSASNNPFGN